MIKVMPVVGVRPQIIKSSPLIMKMQNDSETEVILIHSGQHYDYEMSKIFFKELDLPDPAYNLDIKSGTHAEQTAYIMLKMEKIVERQKPDIVIVFGDANTTLAAALASVKTKIPVAHVEAGLRSWDLRMPEEINRVLTDHVSQVLYAPTEYAVEQLLRENIPSELITLSGDTMYDSILIHNEHIEKSDILEILDVESMEYLLATTHRAENVDDYNRLKNIIKAFIELSKYIKIIFPIHPRTMRRVKEVGLIKYLESSQNIKVIKPIGYFDMLKLIREARAVLTDSGGIQKEAFILRTPCITLRERTEWIGTLRMGGNVLVGADYNLIVDQTISMIENYNEVRKKLLNVDLPYGDGNASLIILENLKERYAEDLLKVDMMPCPVEDFLM